MLASRRNLGNGGTKAPPYKISAGKTCFMEGTPSGVLFEFILILESNLDLGRGAPACAPAISWGERGDTVASGTSAFGSAF